MICVTRAREIPLFSAILAMVRESSSFSISCHSKATLIGCLLSGATVGFSFSRFTGMTEFSLGQRMG